MPRSVVLSSESPTELHQRPLPLIAIQLVFGRGLEEFDRGVQILGLFQTAVECQVALTELVLRATLLLLCAVRKNGLEIPDCVVDRFDSNDAHIIAAEICVSEMGQEFISLFKVSISRH